jgi:hypothetical protein
LLEVLGGPDLFSSSFPGSSPREGPLAEDRLDLEERERLLEIAKHALPPALEEQGRWVVGVLKAHLPLHPAPPSLVVLTPLLPGTSTRPRDSAGRHARGADAAESHNSRHAFQAGMHPSADEPAPAAQAAGHPWPHPARPSPASRGRTTGRWPRWRARSR